MRTWQTASHPATAASNTPARLLAAFLVAVAAALGYANHSVAQLAIDVSPIAAPSVAAAPPPAPSTADVGDAAPASVADLPETTRRPLFYADRRMPKPEEKPTLPPAAAQGPPDLLRLVGIASIGGNSKVLLRNGNESGKWMSIGEEFRGWQLKQVSHDSVIMQARGRVAELKLYPPRVTR